MKKWMRRCSVMLLVLSLMLSMCCQAEPGSAETAQAEIHEWNGASTPARKDAKVQLGSSFAKESVLFQALVAAVAGDGSGEAEDGFVDGYWGTNSQNAYKSAMASDELSFEVLGKRLWAIYLEDNANAAPVEVDGDWQDEAREVIQAIGGNFKKDAVGETEYADIRERSTGGNAPAFVTGVAFASSNRDDRPAGYVAVLGNRVHIKGEDATYRALYIFLAFTRDSAVQRLVYTIKLPEEGETSEAPAVEAIEITDRDVWFEVAGDDGKTESKRLLKLEETDRCTGFWFEFDGEEPEDAPMDEDYTVQVEAEGIDAAEIRVKGNARMTDRIDIAELAPFIGATETIDVTVSKAGEPFAQGRLNISKVTVAEAVASTTITETEETTENTGTDDATASTETVEPSDSPSVSPSASVSPTPTVTPTPTPTVTPTPTPTVTPTPTPTLTPTPEPEPVSIDEITINGEKAGSQPIQVSAGEVTIGWKVTGKADQYTLAVKDGKGKTVIGPISVKADDSPYIIPAEDVEKQLTKEEVYSLELSAVPVGGSEADAVTKRADFYVHAEGTDSAKIHTVTFAYTGTIPDNATVPNGKRCAEGEEFELPAPELAGYDFDGWTLEGKAVRGKTYTMPDRDITFSGSWTAHRHPVSFRYAEGSPEGAPELPETAEYGYGENVQVKPMTMDGYTFTGWTAEGVELDSKNNFIMPDHPVEFVGSWTPIEYEVSYSYTGNVPKDTPAVPEAMKYGFGESVTVAQLPELAGYAFSGWTPDDDSLVIGTDGSFTMPNHAVAFSGSWEANEHKVYYVNAEGSPTNAPIQTVTVAKYGETVLLPTPTLAGYTFAGWTAEGIDTSGSSFIMPDADVTFVGHWSANAFNVAYEYADPAPEGAMMPSAMDHDVGTEVTLADAPVSTGYTFTGWTVYKAPDDGSREEIPVEGNSFTMPAANVVIVGSWTVNQHTVSYAYSEPVPEGAPALPAATEYAYGVAVTVAPAPTMEGYTFTGWNYSDFKMGDVDVVITGGWVVNGYKVTYAFDDSAPEGAQVPPEETISFGAPLDLPDPEVTGYTFLGWKSKDVEADENGGYTMPSHDVTFVGSWQINTHTVTYSYLNAPENAPELPTGGEYKFGDTVDLAPAPGRMFRRECSQWTLPGNATPVGVDEQTGVPVSFRMPDADVVIVGNWVVLENKTGWIPWLLLLLASAAGFVVATVAKGKKKQVYTPSVDLFSHESIKSIRSSHDRDREGERTIRRG